MKVVKKIIDFYNFFNKIQEFSNLVIFLFSRDFCNYFFIFCLEFKITILSPPRFFKISPHQKAFNQKFL